MSDIAPDFKRPCFRFLVSFSEAFSVLFRFFQIQLIFGQTLILKRLHASSYLNSSFIQQIFVDLCDCLFALLVERILF